MATEIIKGMKRKVGWTVEVNGGYARMTCGCENRHSFTLPATPGRGASSKAMVIRDQVSYCPDKHRKMGTNRPKRR